MNTIAFNNTGSPEEVLQIIEKEKPVPEAGQVLIRVLAAPVNPSDIYFIQGKYRIKPELPGQTAGLEGAGLVETTGSGVDIPEGTLVAFFSKNTWAEYVLLSSEELVVLPKDLPIEKASQFTLNPFTAWGLLEISRPLSGEWMLLTGANSAVARIVIQLAHQKGVRIIALIRDMSLTAGLKTLGADLVLDMEDEHLSDRIQQATEGKGIDVAMESVGGSIVTRIIGNMAPFGRLIIYGVVRQDEASQFFNSQIVYKDLTIQGFGIRAFLARQTKDQRAEMIQGLAEAISHPAFQLPVTQVFPWRAFGDALKQNSRSGRSGKTLLKFS